MNEVTCVPLSYIGMLLSNGLRSENAEITKTGIVLCELIEAMKK